MNAFYSHIYLYTCSTVYVLVIFCSVLRSESPCLYVCHQLTYAVLNVQCCIYSICANVYSHADSRNLGLYFVMFVVILVFVVVLWRVGALASKCDIDGNNLDAFVNKMVSVSILINIYTQNVCTVYCITIFPF